MDITKMLKSADLVLRPHALVINPSDKSLILEAMPDIEERVKIYESDIVRKGDIFLMDRKYFEKYNGEGNIWEL